jgi:P4 family phage/plasmid primase-like protien
MQLVDHSPEYGMTYTMPFRYMPELAGKSVRFFEFLHDCWGHDEDYEDKVMALQEALCVTVFGLGPRYQRAILLQGVAKSGKSQMLKIAEALVPEEAKCFVPPMDWADKFMPAMMHGKLINVCGELSERRRIDGQSFKDIVCGSEMSGQLKGQQIFRFFPICTHWFASNHSPRTEDTSEGFNRRWLILEFNKAVSQEKRKTDLGDVIVAEEREAIVSWAVLAMERLLKNEEYTLPASHSQLIKEVAQANNSVRFFMEECPRVRCGISGKRTSELQMYKEYWSFCLGPGGAKPVSSKSFKTATRELQNQLGFQLVIVQNELGASETYYDSVTIVESPRGH